MDHAPPQLDNAPAPAEAPSVVATHDAGTISPEQLAVITTARERQRPIRRAAMTASISGWTLAFFAFTSLLSGLFSVTALLLGLGLSGIAFFELRGARGIRSCDVNATRHLAYNQFALICIVIVYAIAGIIGAVTGPGPYEEQMAAGGQVAEMLAPIESLTRVVSLAYYGILILGVSIAQGCLAAYYCSRGRLLARFLHETPPWVVAVVRE